MEGGWSVEGGQVGRMQFVVRRLPFNSDSSSEWVHDAANAIPRQAYKLQLQADPDMLDMIRFEVSQMLQRPFALAPACTREPDLLRHLFLRRLLPLPWPQEPGRSQGMRNG